MQREAAKADPVGYVADLPERAVLDEVQRVPELFTSLKAAVDADRTPGRFILTGSANVLLVPKLADSLAGRMDILRLHPLAQAELVRQPCRFLSELFAGGFRSGPAGQRFVGGVLLYDGDAVAGFGDRLFAVPIAQLWESNNDPA